MFAIIGTYTLFRTIISRRYSRAQLDELSPPTPRTWTPNSEARRNMDFKCRAMAKSSRTIVAHSECLVSDAGETSEWNMSYVEGICKVIEISLAIRS